MYMFNKIYFFNILNPQLIEFPDVETGHKESIDAHFFYTTDFKEHAIKMKIIELISVSRNALHLIIITHVLAADKDVFDNKNSKYWLEYTERNEECIIECITQQYKGLATMCKDVGLVPSTRTIRR